MAEPQASPTEGLRSLTSPHRNRLPYIILGLFGTLFVKNSGNAETGVHDGSNGAATLTDVTKNWTPNRWANYYLHNTTDGSHCEVTASTTMTATCTLAGGTKNAWSMGDAYVVTDGSGTAVSISGGGSNSVFALETVQERPVGALMRWQDFDGRGDYRGANQEAPSAPKDHHGLPAPAGLITKWKQKTLAPNLEVLWKVGETASGKGTLKKDAVRADWKSRRLWRYSARNTHIVH
jgi:hypothetical protein